MTTDTDQLIGDILDHRAVTPAFQPLVHLETRQVAGFEALARGPEGPLHSPDALLAAARRVGRLGELDWICRANGLRAALGAGLDRSVTWFVNVEPAGLGSPCPDDLRDVVASAREHLRVVTELTEREVERDPARLLWAAAAARRSAWGVALDDVGGESRSLALLSFVKPDVVKLDLSLVRGRRGADVASIANAVRAYAERTGAVLLAEGIETDEQVRLARVLGATYAQGWLFGRPGPLPGAVQPPGHPFRFQQQVQADTGGTPFRVGAAVRPVGIATKEHLLPMSLHLERQAVAGGAPVVLLAAFQRGRYFTGGTRRRYERLSARNVLTVVVGHAMPDLELPGIRSVELAATDPLAAEWAVIVVGPHFSAALLARDCGDGGPDLQRRFEYVVTHERDLVVRAARALLRFVTVPTEPPPAACPPRGRPAPGWWDGSTGSRLA